MLSGIDVHFAYNQNDDMSMPKLLSAIMSGKLQRATPEVEGDKNSKENIENMH